MISGFGPFRCGVAEALSRLGVFHVAGLHLIADIWGAIAFTEFEDYETAERLILATIEGLEARHLITEAATNEDVQILYRSWQWPMYDFEFRPINISLIDLKEEQERHFYSNFG